MLIWNTKFNSSHQVGFFRDLHVNPADNQRRREQPNPPNENQPNQPGETQPADEPAQPPTNTDNQQSLLAVTWMIFTSFFASLIPDMN